ncbi:FxsA family protein [Amycolatopsis anabasis]|uniref:FxsA family protein n=1 Tax=Amycolatopsis anabasis TaxID=1840409 RepID=UPI00131C2371|nr:FxsA family protein [Amycolatopsis anabasis]
MAVVLLLYVVAEVAAVWAVSSAIGFLGTIGLLLAGAFLGSWLARREGARAMRAFVATARAGKPAHAEITDGMLIALGGVLIMLPGFVSDLAGLLLLLPPSRGLVRRAWLRRIEKRAPVGYSAPGGVIVVDSEVVDEQRPPRSHPVIDAG